MGFFVDANENHQLRGELRDSVDIGPDERVRVIADVTLLNVGGAIATVLSFPGAFVLGIVVLRWLMNIVEGPGVAGWCALGSSVLCMLLPVAVVQTSRRLVRRRLRRALRIARQRSNAVLVESTSADGSAVAVPSAMSFGASARRR